MKEVTIENAGPPGPRKEPLMTRFLDDALARLGGAGFEYDGGLSNHGPMAVEALAALRREDAIPAFADDYARRLGSGPPLGTPISDGWTAALGDFGRVADWTARFAEEVAAAPWRSALETWAPRLAPGMIGAATHGWLRTAHAVRALERADTSVRRLELARGLGYWAATFHRLPGARRDRGTLPVEEAAHALPRVAATGAEALLTDGLHRLDGSVAFVDAVARADLGPDPLGTVSALTRAAARLFLANAHRGSLFALAHAVTASSALRIVLPHVSRETGDTLLWHGWQALAGLQTAFGVTSEREPFAAYEDDVEELIERAVRCSDEHGIKFTEACLREHAARPDPVYLAAAHDLLGCFENLARLRRGAAGAVAT
jgi:hypothetical protein